MIAVDVAIHTRKQLIHFGPNKSDSMDFVGSQARYFEDQQVKHLEIEQIREKNNIIKKFISEIILSK